MAMATSDQKRYVLFGCPGKDDPEHYAKTGYIGKDGLKVVEDIEDARKFAAVDVDKWMGFYNSEESLGESLGGWKFHKVATTLS